MKKSITIVLCLIVCPNLAFGFSPVKKHETTKPGNVFNTMMLEQVEEATEDFNEVVVINPKQKKPTVSKDKEKQLEDKREKPLTSPEAQTKSKRHKQKP